MREPTRRGTLTTLSRERLTPEPTNRIGNKIRRLMFAVEYSSPFQSFPASEPSHIKIPMPFTRLDRACNISHLMKEVVADCSRRGPVRTKSVHCICISTFSGFLFFWGACPSGHCDTIRVHSRHITCHSLHSGTPPHVIFIVRGTI